MRKKALLLILILIGAASVTFLVYFVFQPQEPGSPCWIDNPIRINEVLYDPPDGDLYGDANGDGTRDSWDDEFVEIVCMNGTYDFSGCELLDNSGVIHTFPGGSIVPAGGSIVVFGGGNIEDFTGDFGGAIVQVGSGTWNGLGNSGDNIILRKGTKVLDNLTYVSGAADNQALTRAPDICGDFRPHNDVSAFNYTPGSTINGDHFNLGILINEVLYDPPDGLYGDANGDGTRDSWDDEFVEIVNNFSTEFNLSGCELYDNGGLRHIFPDGTILSSGGAIVVFGGGNIGDFTGDFGGAIVQVSSESWGGLSNTADQVLIIKDGFILAAFGYEDSLTNPQSLTRSPDVTGNFVPHNDASAAYNYTAGTTINGTPFV